jgi:hypothetical protein
MITQSQKEVFYGRIDKASLKLVQASLVPIYVERDGPLRPLDQVGTGFLIRHQNQTFLGTAKHVLRGKDHDEDPWAKVVIASGRRFYLNDLHHTGLVEAVDEDVAIIHIKEFETERCLPSDVLGEWRSARLLTIHGFLSRDFKRNAAANTTFPKPWVITNAVGNPSARWIEMKYPRSRFRDAQSKLVVTAPIPAGISGSPMLDSLELFWGKVRILGVFTEQDNGKARGEWAAVVRRLLDEPH